MRRYIGMTGSLAEWLPESAPSAASGTSPSMLGESRTGLRRGRPPSPALDQEGEKG
jgi:hypothetical protein